jgi:leucine dehydrogenase
MVFEHPDFDRHHQVSFFADGRVIIAVHRLGALGTAGGGCRMRAYRDEREALGDVLRLSRAMSYKLALLEVPVGGAKAVVLGDPARDKSAGLLRAVGRAVEALGGRFIVGEDVGIGGDDLRSMETRWLSPQPDSAEAAAEGVVACMRRALRARLGRGDFDGVRVAVQGMGRVGSGVARRLRQEGAQLIVADVDPARAAGDPDAIYDADADVFAPCALGGVLDEHTIARLRCAVVAGAANNQLADARLAETLAARNILYVPDFVAGGGGVLGAQAARLGDVLDGVLARAAREQVTPLVAAERLARERFGAMGGEL